MTEEQLVVAISNGDQEAFRQLVEMYQNRIYNTCLGYLKIEEDAEDIAQEVFIEVFRSIHQFKGDARLSTWLYRVAINKSLEEVRKHKARKRYGFLLSWFGREELVDQRYRSFEHPGVTLENKERATILIRHLEKLSEKQRTAFQLNKLEGLSYAEIASIMNTSLSSVESLIHRAKKNLRKSLRRYYENEKK